MLRNDGDFTLIYSLNEYNFVEFEKTFRDVILSNPARLFFFKTKGQEDNSFWPSCLFSSLTRLHRERWTDAAMEINFSSSSFFFVSRNKLLAFVFISFPFVSVTAP